jgi:hypothetical protein
MDPNEPISGHNYFFKPPTWTEEAFEDWKREVQREKRKRDKEAKEGGR